MSTTIWYTVSDSSSRRAIESSRWPVSGFPVTADHAKEVAEECAEQHIAAGNDWPEEGGVTFKLYKDDKPDTKPRWLVSVSAEWVPLVGAYHAEKIPTQAEIDELAKPVSAVLTLDGWVTPLPASWAACFQAILMGRPLPETVDRALIVARAEEIIRRYSSSTGDKDTADAS